MKGKTKKSIIVLIVLLAIGFAAVTTTLTINGIIRLGANQENFEKNIIFENPRLTYTGEVGATADETDNVEVINDGKGIQFTTKTLKNIGSTATLTYDIANNSQYTAEFTGITCTVKNADDQDVTAAVTGGSEYITLNAQDFMQGEEGSKTNIKIAPTAKITDHTLTVTMRKSYVGTEENQNKTTYTVNCEISASGLSE